MFSTRNASATAKDYSRHKHWVNVALVIGWIVVASPPPTLAIVAEPPRLASVSTPSPGGFEQIAGVSSVSEPIRHVYQNIRVTVTRRGIVAGDLRTGRVIWRRGFAPNPDHHVLFESVRFVKRYFVYRYDAGSAIGGSFVDILTGKDLFEATALLTVEGTVAYLRNFDFFNRQGRSFADIQIIRFNTANQNTRTVSFIVDQYVSSACGEPTRPAINLGFTKKVGDRWFFEYRSEKCDVALNFDFNNVAANAVKVVRKERK